MRLPTLHTRLRKIGFRFRDHGAMQQIGVHVAANDKDTPTADGTEETRKNAPSDAYPLDCYISVIHDGLLLGERQSF